MDANLLNVILNIGGLVLGGTALGVVLRYKLGMRKLALTDEADIRDHYAAEVARLVEKMDRREKHFLEVEKHLRELIATSDRRHEECEAARAEDRREHARMRDEIEGMKRQIIRYSSEGVLVLSEQPSEHVEGAARRVRDIVDGNKK